MRTGGAGAIAPSRSVITLSKPAAVTVPALSLVWPAGNNQELQFICKGERVAPFSFMACLNHSTPNPFRCEKCDMQHSLDLQRQALERLQAAFDRLNSSMERLLAK